MNKRKNKKRKIKKRKDLGTIKKRKTNFQSNLKDIIDILFQPYVNKLQIKNINEINDISNKKREIVEIINFYENHKKWSVKFDIDNFYITNECKKKIKLWIHENNKIISAYKKSPYFFEKCFICYKHLHCNSIIADVLNDDYTILLECNHSFHKNCLLKWMDQCNWISKNSWRKKLTCPLCRNYDPNFYMNKISYKYNDFLETHFLK
jgi:hypothetical protein